LAKELSFLVLSSSGNTVKRAHCPHWILYGISGALVLLMLIIAAGLTDYIRLSHKNLENHQLKAELTLKRQESIRDRRQIQTFAREINQLKDRIVELNQVDQQIRRVAGMEASNELFGIGGSTPEDLNPDMELKRQHAHLIREMHQQVQELENAALYQRNSFKDLWKVVEKRGNFMAYTPTIRPTRGWISSYFGYRKSPYTGKREFHEGLDIANSLGTKIKATADGRVAFTGERRGYGNVILIDHGHGLETLYAHLEKILKRRGDMVKRGDIIAYMGNTGHSTGSHLHYEVRLNGMPVNPQKFILN
jgi:murein DD-endopeptidase MepM/ murein hydrolase activator NlpD